LSNQPRPRFVNSVSWASSHFDPRFPQGLGFPFLS
jgi:hypothetical protein